MWEVQEGIGVSEPEAGCKLKCAVVRDLIVMACFDPSRVVGVFTTTSSKVYNRAEGFRIMHGKYTLTRSIRNLSSIIDASDVWIEGQADSADLLSCMVWCPQLELMRSSPSRDSRVFERVLISSILGRRATLPHLAFWLPPRISRGSPKIRYYDPLSFWGISSSHLLHVGIRCHRDCLRIVEHLQNWAMVGSNF